MIKTNLQPCGRQPDCMVFVDAENIGGTRTLSSLLAEVSGYGQRFGLLAYGVTPQHRRAYEVAGFTLMTGPRARQRHKNFVDQQISVDAIELAVRDRSVKTFVIASGDGDFVPLFLSSG